jgi:hypothetical protein
MARAPYTTECLGDPRQRFPIMQNLDRLGDILAEEEEK